MTRGGAVKEGNETDCPQQLRSLWPREGGAVTSVDSTPGRFRRGRVNASKAGPKTAPPSRYSRTPDLDAADRVGQDARPASVRGIRDLDCSRSPSGWRSGGHIGRGLPDCRL